MTLYGNTEPRIWTPPLRELTPETSYGFALCEFSENILGAPLDPWQRFAAIHMGELLEDGRPRFRQVLIMVSRQNGKTTLLKAASLYWLFVERTPLVLGTSTSLDHAREVWEKAATDAENSPILSEYVQSVRRANGEQTITTTDNCRYKIAPANRRGGRSLSIDRLIIDELREHDSWDAYNAAIPAMNARPFGQAVFLSNQGDSRAIVLEALRDSAIRQINTGEGDPRLGLFEWSAPDGCDLMDEEAWKAANPNLGYRLDRDAIAGPAARAVEAGGQEETGFRTEMLCQRVDRLDPAVDSRGWADCADPAPMDGMKTRPVMVFDISPDGMHATLAVAAQIEGADKVRVELVQSWRGAGCITEFRRELPGWIEKVRPSMLGWFPMGPAAAMAADMAASKMRSWPPAGVKIEEIRDAPAVCMGFAEAIRGRTILHSDQPLLNDHVIGVQRLTTGDRWVFSRKGAGHADAAYAAAGAVHLAKYAKGQGLPPRIITSSTRRSRPDGPSRPVPVVRHRTRG